MGGSRSELNFTDDQWRKMHGEIVECYRRGGTITNYLNDKGFTKNQMYCHFQRLGLPTNIRNLVKRGVIRESAAKHMSKFVKFVPAGGEIGSKIEVVCGTVRVLVDSTDTEGLKTAIKCCKEMENA